MLLLTANAASADGTVPLHEPHIGSTAAGFGTQICGDENFEPGPDGYDAWHFVLPGNAGTGFLSLTVNFGANGSITVTADGGGPNNSYIRDDPHDQHAYVFTPAGWTLTGGTATVSGTPAQGANFVLSHTCPGSGDGSSPSPTPSDGNGGSSSPPGNGGGGGGGGGGLPVTGTAVGAILVAGLGLLGAGVVLLVVRRRRDVFES
ncbi:MAG TPA: LPXTG cell wall anchor domain-containing protein [Micromonosporaceae bacterium]|nr:LPXTG cell wall anchor domain-containing protein [Micromonosporaceae bacterium]